MKRFLLACILSLISLSAFSNNTDLGTNHHVLSGIDRLLTPEYIGLIKHKRVALVVNSASVDNNNHSV